MKKLNESFNIFKVIENNKAKTKELFSEKKNNEFRELLKTLC